jgi:hypothetical protein
MNIVFRTKVLFQLSLQQNLECLLRRMLGHLRVGQQLFQKIEMNVSPCKTSVEQSKAMCKLQVKYNPCNYFRLNCRTRPDWMNRTDFRGLPDSIPKTKPIGPAM